MLSDDNARRAAAAPRLAAYGYRVRACARPEQLYRLHERHGVRLVLLAVSPAQVYAVASRLRAADPLVGIVAASNFRGFEGRVRAMQCGADVCLPREVQVEELVAVLHAVGRRVGVAAVPPVGAVPAAAEPGPAAGRRADGKWRLLSQGWVLADPHGMQMSLTTSERDLMLLLLARPGRKVERAELLQACAGAGVREGVSGRALDVMISRLRTKARRLGMALPLRSVFRQGYMFAGEV